MLGHYLRSGRGVRSRGGGEAVLGAVKGVDPASEAMVNERLIATANTALGRCSGAPKSSCRLDLLDCAPIPARIHDHRVSRSNSSPVLVDEGGPSSCMISCLNSLYI